MLVTRAVPPLILSHGASALVLCVAYNLSDNWMINAYTKPPLVLVSTQARPEGTELHAMHEVKSAPGREQPGTRLKEPVAGRCRRDWRPPGGVVASTGTCTMGSFGRILKGLVA